MAFALSVSPVKLDGAGLDQRHQDREVLAHVADRLVEREPNMFSITIWCESPMPSTSRPLGREPATVSACCGEHHRVARVRRDDAGAELDAGHLAADDRERR